MATKRKRIVDENSTIATKTKKVKINLENQNNEPVIAWKDYELLADKEQIDVDLSQTLIDLLDNDNTIPFLCRYRKHLIRNTTPEKLRDIQNTLNSVRDLKCKVENFYKTLEKKQEISEELKSDIKEVKSFEELEFIKSLHKSEGKRTLFERANELGLGPVATEFLAGSKKLKPFESYVNKQTEGLQSPSEIEKGVKDILVHMIFKNKLIIEEIRRLKEVHTIRVESKQTKASKEDKNAYKFETYFDFSMATSNLKPHQILALFRGESLKILKLSFTFNDYFQKNLNKFAKDELLKRGADYEMRSKFFDDAFKEAFSKRISPFVVRQLRTELQNLADKAAISSFADNLKNLLLVVPVKGRKILGVDPGFKNGCKLALISEFGEVIETDTIYPHASSRDKANEAARNLVDILKRNSCTLIALGNGTACRETETFLDKIIKDFMLKNVEYCIVSEQGASIYSCSDIAKKEFPKMDTNVVSAVSIARRLLDPLSELVKIEPKHLGVGMYQHDVEEKRLSSTLDSIVSECVSYVGVDINCASLSLLKFIAGLTEKTALCILEHKKKNGLFKSRDELLKVKTIGEKTYTQMIGFIRIDKSTCGDEKINILDSTSIHPESYKLTEKILKDCKLKADDLGRKSFKSEIKKYSEKNSIEDLAKKFKEEAERIKTVLDVLTNEDLNYDYRNETNFQPDFKKGLQKLSDLQTNQSVNGIVRNIVDFGAFIDIGVQQDGLLHKSKYKIPLKLGDKVECKILSIGENGKRISLDFVKKL
ncbi:hypothetical protein ACKWTF_005319 [Chironomus riparius]